MGQRTKNRILEHSGPGHRLEQSLTTHKGVAVVQKPEDANKHFWLCNCGWEGWLTKDLNEKE